MRNGYVDCYGENGLSNENLSEGNEKMYRINKNKMLFRSTFFKLENI